MVLSIDCKHHIRKLLVSGNICCTFYCFRVACTSYQSVDVDASRNHRHPRVLCCTRPNGSSSTLYLVFGPKQIHRHYSVGLQSYWSHVELPFARASCITVCVSWFSTGIIVLEVMEHYILGRWNIVLLRELSIVGGSRYAMLLAPLDT